MTNYKLQITFFEDFNTQFFFIQYEKLGLKHSLTVSAMGVLCFCSVLLDKWKTWAIMKENLPPEIRFKF